MNFQNSGLMSAAAQPIYGPHRVLPGRLSVTRTFGDIEAKLLRFGGNPNVVVATPDIKEFDITDKTDFILLASDGIFDKLSTKETVEAIWYEAKGKKSNGSNFKNVHEFCGVAVDTTLKFGLGRKTMDNVTVVVIGFDNFKRNLFPSSSSAPPASNTPSNPNNNRDISPSNSNTSHNLSSNQISKDPNISALQNNSNNSLLKNSSVRLSSGQPNSQQNGVGQQFQIGNAKGYESEKGRQDMRNSAEYNAGAIRQSGQSSNIAANYHSANNSGSNTYNGGNQSSSNNNNQYNFKYKMQYLQDTRPNYPSDSRFPQQSSYSTKH